MIPKLDSPQTLKIISLLAGGMRNFHVLVKESGFDISYNTLSRYVANSAQFDESVYANLFDILRKKDSFMTRETVRTLEDTYVVLNELVGQGVIVPKRVGEAGELDEDWEKKQTFTKEEVKDMEAEFGKKLTTDQREVLMGKRKQPKPSVSVDDLFDDDEEEIIEFARNSKAEVLIHPSKEEAKKFLKEDELDERAIDLGALDEAYEDEPKPKDSSFLEELLDGEEEGDQISNGLTDPFEKDLRRTEDVFTSENQRI